MGSQASKTATILSGASLSSAVDTLGLVPVAIIMPAAWTAANITLQASYDGSTYYDVYDLYGTEVLITASTSRYIILEPDVFYAVRMVKLRSGTTGTPVNQGADRVLTVICKEI